MLPVAIHDLSRADLSAAADDLVAAGCCLMMLDARSAEPHLPPALEAEIAAAARYPDGPAGPRGRGHLLRRRMARAVAAQVLGVRPWDIRIEHDAMGAPHFAGIDSGLHLSFSACCDLGLVAVARKPVGVDIEQRIKADTIPWNLLRADESEHIRRLPPVQLETVFLRLWSIKEAFLKSIGQGFAAPPERVQVDCETVSNQIIVLFLNSCGPLKKYENIFFEYMHFGDPRSGAENLFGISLSLLSD